MENTLSDSTRPLLKLDFPLYVLEKTITMRDLFYPCLRISSTKGTVECQIMIDPIRYPDK